MSAVAEAPTVVVRESPPARAPRKRWTRFVLPTYTTLVIVYLTLPVLVMVVYGFNNIAGERQTADFQGFTLDWYKNVFSDPTLESAFLNSLKLAPISALIATALGTLFGLALGRYAFRGRALTMFVIFLAIAVPEIVLGASLLSMFVQSGAPLGFGSTLVSHVGFSIAFVAVTVRARVEGLDRALESAAQDLYATPVTAFFKVTLPLIAPGIIAGFLLAFVLSLDDFVITNFVSGTYTTFPLWVFGAQKIGLPPTVNVMGTLLFAAGLLLALLQVIASRRRPVS
ncbi:MAG: ABC transporter permease [Actinomycetota bacterium]